MSSVTDPAKLKVVELRAELSNRGLDAKGNKAALVKRLKDALEKELETELPNTSIADTSTEDINTSQVEEEPPAEKPADSEVPPDGSAEAKKEAENAPDATVPEISKTEPITTTPSGPEPNSEPKDEEPSKETPVKVEEAENPEKQTSKKEENGERQELTEEGPPCKKSRFENIQDNNESSEGVKSSVEDTAAVEQVKKEPKEPKAQKNVRPKTPVKEDEPPIDASKVQLNWYDSDLHLQIDKETFLKAKPYHDGIFGYVWSGVRATHGTNTGKVCYEVKITEELKWEDVIKQPEKGNRDRDRNNPKQEPPKPNKADNDTGNSKLEENGPQENVVSEEKSDEMEVSEQQPNAAEGEPVQVQKGLKEVEDKKEAENVDNKEGHIEQMEVDQKSEEVTEKKEELAEKKEEVEVKKDEVKEKKEVVEEKEEEIEEKKEGGEEKKEDVEEKKEDVEEKKEDVEEKKEDVEEKAEEIKIPPYLIRIGWSASSENLQLGESKYSYGFESSGKFVSDRQFTEYGKSFGVGDVIGTFLTFSDESVNFIYTINGEELPLAVSIPRNQLPDGEFLLFPHVLSKNYAFEVNFGDSEEPLCKIPEKLSEYKFLNTVEDKILGPQRPETRSECEVIMMIGLPASGKTYWVNDYIEKNKDKKYTVIGNTQLLEKMTVDGTPFRNSIKPYWNTLMEKLTKTSNKLVDVASTRRRNIVIDQTNESHQTQRRRMKQFDGYKRRAVVVVCGDEEQNKRKALYEEQQDTKLGNVYLCQIKANISIPRCGEWLEEVSFVELKEDEAKSTVQRYNKEGRDAGYGQQWQRRDNRNNRFNKWQDNRRNDYHGGFRNKYPPPRYDNRGHKPDYRSPRWGQNDRRNAQRDWRSPRGAGPRPQDRSRDHHGRPGGRDNYNRNRNQGGRNWQQGGNWNQGWNHQGQWSQGGGGNWNQGWNQGGGGGKWGGYNQGGGGYGQQGGYGNDNYANWNNYYGQQNWNQNQGSNSSMSGNGH